MNNCKLIAFYLPQYHPVPENDEWWGKGFTEWTNVARAKSLFKGHQQPKIPADLGFYDLRIPEVREEQARLAKEAGITGFCYWHYWFAGKRLMEKPFNEVLEAGKPDFPFCLCWANHSWYAKNWNTKDAKRVHKLLIEQTYPGDEDYIKHFETLLPAFKDKRYMKEGNKPIFGIYNAPDIPDMNHFIELWNELAIKNGFDGIYFFAYVDAQPKLKLVQQSPFNKIVVDLLPDIAGVTTGARSFYRRVMIKLNLDRFMNLRVVDYSHYTQKCLAYFAEQTDYTPCVIPNYDHSPRSGNAALVLHNTSPFLWGKFLGKIIKMCTNRKETMIFIKSWNEWGEGNYLEPDLYDGKKFILETQKAISDVDN